MTKRSYAVVGTGRRVPMFIDPIADTYRDSARLTGLCDVSPTRMNYRRDRLAAVYGTESVPTYEARDFDRMLAAGRPDVVIVCTPDHLHHDYIVRSLDFGADVISEKPLTIDAEKFAAIDAAVRRSGRGVRTCFNYRWAPGATQVRRLMAAGEIGAVKHVAFEYMLNTSHGADYFRRWHSEKRCSGGLLVHKSTHHFDLINWWIDAIPETVFALGGLMFYGKANAVARGQEGLTRYPRYTGVAEAKTDPFRVDLEASRSMNALYRKAEADCGYIRDRNVFREGIDIEDSLALTLRYRTAVIANYSLNAFCPGEGYRVVFTGDGGRLEYAERHASHLITGDHVLKSKAGARRGATLRLQKLFSDEIEIPVATLEGETRGTSRGRPPCWPGRRATACWRRALRCGSRSSFRCVRSAGA